MPENHEICEDAARLPECDGLLAPLDFCVATHGLPTIQEHDVGNCNVRLYGEHIFVFNVFQYVCYTHPDERQLILSPCPCLMGKTCISKGSIQELACDNGHVYFRKCFERGWNVSDPWDCNVLRFRQSLGETKNNDRSVYKEMNVWIYVGILLFVVLLLVMAYRL